MAFTEILATKANPGGSSPNVACVPTANATANKLIVLGMDLRMVDVLTFSISITDTKGNMWVVDKQRDNGGTNACFIASTYQDGGALTTGDTITVDTGNSNVNSYAVWIEQLDGYIRPSDANASNQGSGTSGATGTTGATAQANEVAVSLHSSSTNAAVTKDAAYTAFTTGSQSIGGTNLSGIMAYKILSATGTQSATATFSSGSWTALIVTYRAGQRVLPAQIGATSTASGRVAATKKVNPTQVNATSTCSGALVSIRAIGPVTVNAISILSGSVTATKLVNTATILASSILSGYITAYRVILPSSISATSLVTGEVAAIRPISPASVAATSIASGTLSLVLVVSPATISAISTMTGALTAMRVVVGNVDAASVVSGDVATIRSYIATILATSSVTGFLAGQIRGGGVNATSTVAGSVVRYGVVGGAVSASVTVTGGMQVERTLSGPSISATSTATGSLDTFVPAGVIYGGNVWATSTVTGIEINVLYPNGLVAILLSAGDDRPNLIGATR